jgi:hypothetical protein
MNYVVVLMKQNQWNSIMANCNLWTVRWTDDMGKHHQQTHVLTDKMNKLVGYANLLKLPIAVEVEYQTSEEIEAIKSLGLGVYRCDECGMFAVGQVVTQHLNKMTRID